MADQRYVFVVKLWLEPDDCGPGDRPVLRGSVAPIDSGETRYFTSLDRLGQIVGELTDLPPEAVSPGRKGP